MYIQVYKREHQTLINVYLSTFTYITNHAYNVNIICTPGLAHCTKPTALVQVGWYKIRYVGIDIYTITMYYILR